MKKNSLRFLVCFISLLSVCVTEKSFAMGRIPKKEYQQKVDELEKTKKECDATTQNLQQKNQALENQNTQLTKDLDASKAELEQRVAELEKQKSSEVEKLKSTYDNLVTDMKKEIQNGSIQITQLQDKLSVSLVDKIVFNSGESQLNDQGKQVLKRVADILKKVKGKQIRIEGHTDNIAIGGALKEKFPSNWELSAARATTVARYLQDAGGIDPKLLSAAGYSQFKPVADNSTPEGRSKNRRIEIVLVPMESSLQSSLVPTKTTTPTPEKEKQKQ